MHTHIACMHRDIHAQTHTGKNLFFIILLFDFHCIPSTHCPQSGQHSTMISMWIHVQYSTLISMWVYVQQSTMINRQVHQYAGSCPAIYHDQHAGSCPVFCHDQHAGPSLHFQYSTMINMQAFYHQPVNDMKEVHAIVSVIISSVNTLIHFYITAVKQRDPVFWITKPITFST